MPEAPALEETERETGETLTSRSQTRKLIRTVELQMETGEFDAFLQAVGEKDRDFGGYTERSDVMGKQADSGRKSHFAYCQPYSQDPDGPSG